jgi:alginate O-acetyltransferase complex protein AlgI
MSFTSIEFPLFLALIWFLYRGVPPRWRFAFLVAVSYLFYSTAGLLASVLLALLSLLTFVAAISVDRFRERSASTVVCILAVVLLTAYLIFFKAKILFPKHGFSSWIMPLGLSYYTFKLISYVVDVQWGKMKAVRRIIPFAAYVSFFPQIVAGPIQRGTDFFEQEPHPGVVVSAVPRIAWGFAKKLIVADHLAPAVDYIFSHITGSHGLLWLGLYLWPLQLYADFSGLTDIAIGAGLLFGIRGPENFNRPFTATSISDYWRRWHMSLTTWLVDYVFTPLRMMTRDAGNVGLVFSITVNMLAIGLWHGLTWGYFTFGAIHAVFLSADAITVRRRKNWFKAHPRYDGLGSWFGWLLTFQLVALTLVLFRARTVHDAWSFAIGLCSSIPGGNVAQLGKGIIDSMRLGLVGYLVLELCERFRPDRWILEVLDTGPRFMRWSLYGSAVLLFTFGLLLLIAGDGSSHNPFIYEIF